MDLVFWKPQSAFREPYQFHDVDAQDHLTESRFFNDPSFSIPVRRFEKAIDAVPPSKEVGAFTPWSSLMNIGVQYEPIFFSNEELEEIEQSPGFADFLSNSTTRALLALNENALFDPSSSPFPATDEDAEIGTSRQMSLKEYQAYSHLSYTQGRAISAMDWTQAGGNSYILISLVEPLLFDDRAARTEFYSGAGALVWSLLDQMHPVVVLASPVEITVIAFCPSRSGVVAGGTVDGTVVVWDFGALTDVVPGTVVQPLSVSHPISSHLMAVTSLRWLSTYNHMTELGDLQPSTQNAGATQFVTASPDGACIVWDVARDRSDGADGAGDADENVIRRLFKVDLCTPLKLTPLHPLCVEPLPPRGGGSPRFMVASEEGVLGVGIWDRAISAQASNSTINKQQQKRFRSYLPLPSFGTPTLFSARAAHKSCVHTLEISHALPDLVLTADSRAFCLWFDKCDTHAEAEGSVVRGLGIEAGLVANHPLAAGEVRLLRHEGEELARDVMDPRTGALGTADVETKEEAPKPFPPVFISPDDRTSTNLITAACLSSTRPSVVFVGTSQGEVEIWDIMDRTSEPVLSTQICVGQVTSIRYFRRASLLNARRVVTYRDILAVGTAHGKLHLVEIPRSYRTRMPHEKNHLKYFFGRYIEGVHSVHLRRQMREATAGADFSAE